MNGQRILNRRCSLYIKILQKKTQSIHNTASESNTSSKGISIKHSIIDRQTDTVSCKSRKSVVIKFFTQNFIFLMVTVFYTADAQYAAKSSLKAFYSLQQKISLPRYSTFLHLLHTDRQSTFGTKNMRVNVYLKCKQKGTRLHTFI